METRRQERLQKLINVLKETDKIHLREAASILGVSEMTIRRDLSLESSSLILLGGYIVVDPKTNNVNNYFITEQNLRNVEGKRYIGKLAASLVTEHDVIFFDSGTTVPFIIDCIPDEIVFTGVCYSLNTFLALQEKPHCRVILCGGELRSNSYVFSSVGRFNELDYICPNKALISAAGVSLEQGVTCFILDEVKMKIQAMSVSQHKTLVVDHVKIGQVRAGRFAALEQFDQVITDQKPDEIYQQFMREHQVKMVY